jgi:acetylserotonin O-methyltransferase
MNDIDPTLVLDLIDGFRRSQTLFAAVQLGIFDGLRPDGAEVDRLLEACASLGLLAKSEGGYANTEVGDTYLRSQAPGSLAGYIRFASAGLYLKWANLAEVVGGEAARKLTDPGSLETKPHSHRDFMDGMQGFGMLSSERVASAFDLSAFSMFMDLGGSTGHLALAILDRYPAMKVGVFDLPEVIEHTRIYTGEKASLHPGNFFIDPLPPADLYGLGKVLHNCGEQNIAILLDRIYQALPSGGGLLVAERLLDEDRRGPVHVHMSSLNMLVASMGRERSFSEYRPYVLGAGFRTVEMRKIGAPVDAILALK